MRLAKTGLHFISASDITSGTISGEQGVQLLASTNNTVKMEATSLLVNPLILDQSVVIFNKLIFIATSYDLEY